MWGALSDGRTGLSFTIAAGPHQRSHSQVRVRLPIRRLLRLAGRWWQSITCPFMTWCGPQTENTMYYSSSVILFIRCHGIACPFRFAGGTSSAKRRAADGHNPAFRRHVRAHPSTRTFLELFLRDWRFSFTLFGYPTYSFSCNIRYTRSMYQEYLNMTFFLGTAV
jgi:hypothetical protein